MPSPSLLQRAATGDADAFGQCVDRFGPLVWTLARRSDPQTADDAVQEIFIDLWKYAGRYDPSVASESTFVSVIARRRLVDRWRRRRREPPKTDIGEYVEYLASAPGAAETRLERAEDSAAAKAALAELRPGQRRVLEMLLLDGRTYQETAAALKMPLGTVKSHARRGLQRVRELLDAKTARLAEGRKSS